MKKVERNRYSNGKTIIETRTLTFEPWSIYHFDHVLNLIQQNLTLDLLNHKRLLFPEDKGVNRYYGHCYHASQAMFYLIDTNELDPMSAEDYRGEKHWWLQYIDPEYGEMIYDCTAEQYWSVNQNPPYQEGKKTKWYGWKGRPQQVTLELMKRVLGDRLISDTVT